MPSKASRTLGLAAVLVTAGLLALAAPAQAVYIETPLRLHIEEHQVDVGDEVVFTIDATNESTAQEWAGRTVRAVFSYDKNEGQHEEEPDQPTSDEGFTQVEILPDLRLDENAQATLTWTVPEEVQDRNVHVALLDDEENQLAIVPLAVGNAEPRMYAASGPAGEPAEGGEVGEPDATDAPPAATDGEAQDDAPVGGSSSSSVPAPGILAFVGAVAVAGIAVNLLHRRRKA